MNSDDARVHRNTWRLLLCIATGDADARRTLVREVGPDPTAWYSIACTAALHAVVSFDTEHLATEAMHTLDPSGPDEVANAFLGVLDTIAAARGGGTDYPARDSTIRRIERALADFLDENPSD